MKFDVVNTKNKKVGNIELDDSVFGAVVRPHMFWETVRMQMANRRAGTHSTKTVSEVSGSGKRPYRQKGTGQARHGTKRAMNMRGGGVVHGPRPRDYSYKMPRKQVQVALRSALSLRCSENALHVVKGWAPKAPKTKDAIKVLNAIDAPKALVIGSKDDDTLDRSLRNFPKAKFLPVEAINVYDILYYDHLILTEGVVAQINERLHTAPSRSEQAARAAE